MSDRESDSGVNGEETQQKFKGKITKKKQNSNNKVPYGRKRSCWKKNFGSTGNDASDETPGGIITCAICGIQRYYKFIKQTKKFGLPSCEPCRKFISSMILNVKNNQPTLFSCLRKGPNNCLKSENNSLQDINVVKTKKDALNAVRCKACWLILCLEKYEMPPGLRNSLAQFIAEDDRPSFSTNETDFGEIASKSADDCSDEPKPSDNDAMIEFLISRVEEKPILWCPTIECSENSHKISLAWKEICNIMYPNFYSLPWQRRGEIEETLRRRWDIIRNQWLATYKSEICKNTKETQTKLLRTEYFDKMKFLTKILPYWETNLIGVNQRQAPVQTSVTAESNVKSVQIMVKDEVKLKAPNVDVEESNLDVSSSAIENKNKTIRKKTTKLIPSNVTPRKSTSNETSSAVESKPEAVKPEFNLKTGMPSKADLLKSWEESASSLNPHMSFFAGIVPALDDFNRDQIIEFQMTVLRTIQNIRKRCLKNVANSKTTVTKTVPKSTTTTSNISANKKEKIQTWFVQLKKKRRK